MKISVRWLLSYLDPPGLELVDVEQGLTAAGFPIESRTELPGGDVALDVEVTTNRGDALSHVGLARELAARTGRTLVLPPIGPLPDDPAAEPVERVLSLDNQVPELCPRFTARVIRGVRVGPSPPWLVERLTAVGLRPINNIVDATNFLTFEWGQPAHAFDLDRLAGPQLIIRRAHPGEPLTTLDGRARALTGSDVVVADARTAQSLAGVIGGMDSAVHAETRDVVLEVATWDPVAIRRTARHHQVRTDASFRFERLVDPRTLDTPAMRLTTLVLELAGGRLCRGTLDQGRTPEPLRGIVLRPDRCRQLLGTDLSDDEMIRVLSALGLEVEPHLARSSAGRARPELLCRIPPWRPDLEREVDLIEEVARVVGYERIPALPRLTVTVPPPQPGEQALTLVGTTLAGLGFYETVTFSFVADAVARQFLAPDQAPLRVDDARRRQETTLRPSVLPGLLACRRTNQDAGVSVPGGVRLFETAAIFARDLDEVSAPSPLSAPAAPALDDVLERRMLALLMDLPGAGKGRPPTLQQQQMGIRLLRGALEALVVSLGGPAAVLELRPEPPPMAALEPAASARVLLNRRPIGWLGLISTATRQTFDLDLPQVAAEVELDPLLALYPPVPALRPPPQFPSIERDLSLVIPEGTIWATVREMVESAGVPWLERVQFVDAYRGPQIGPGRQSLTLRLTFRDPARTLRREEIEPHIEAIIALARQRLDATLRA